MRKQGDPFYLSETSVQSFSSQTDQKDFGIVVSSQNSALPDLTVKYTIKKTDDIPPGAKVVDDRSSNENKTEDLSTIDLRLYSEVAEEEKKSNKKKGKKVKRDNLTEFVEDNHEISEEVLSGLFSRQQFLCGDSIVRVVILNVFARKHSL